MTALWPHQTRTLQAIADRRRPGAAICVAGPTGSGKSRVMVELLRSGARAALYTNRRMLLDQLSGVLDAQGIRHGVRAAGHPTDFTKPVQLCSSQTINSRTLKSKKWPLPDADTVLIDEAHVQKEGVMVEIIDRHKAQGATVLGFTATPLNIGHIYGDIINAATVSECRECGALVPAIHFAPDEPDCSKIKRTPTGEYSAAEVGKLIKNHAVLGRVIEHWHRLNPMQKPTLLFAPGVGESLWFAEQLCAAGIPAAHIDGDSIWMDGEQSASDKWERDKVCEALRTGAIKIICNRFVLREGIDLPFVEHLIFATIFGALSSYIQSGGRGLRSCPAVGKTHATIQDHGGNWHRHGSLNADREWHLDRTDYQVGEMREQGMREKREIEPILCPKCHAVRVAGPKCLQCGYAHTSRSRMVIQHDGKLREVSGDIYRPPRVYREKDVAEKWAAYYWRAKKSRKPMTFNQAKGLFAYENGWAMPPKGLPLQPIDDIDWFRDVKDVPFERLHGFPGAPREVA